MKTHADLMNKIDADIDRVGWSAIGVMPTTDQPYGMPFIYSIGFYNYSNHPEMIIVGLDPNVGHTMLHTLFERVRSGERFEDGQRVSEVLDGYDVEFRAMPPAGRPLNAARSYFELEELPALQVMWPDAEGLFPGEPGFSEQFLGRQDLDEDDL